MLSDSAHGPNLPSCNTHTHACAHQGFPAGMPKWVGCELTGDVRFYNSVLSKKPFGSWPENEQREILDG